MSEQEHPSSYLKLGELSTTSLQLNEQTFTVLECPANVFDAWIGQVVQTIVNVNRQKWEPYEKWRIINYYLKKGLLARTSGEAGQLLVVVLDTEPEAKSEVAPEPASEAVGA